MALFPASVFGGSGRRADYLGKIFLAEELHVYSVLFFHDHFAA
jgi:hypothetical protein